MNKHKISGKSSEKLLFGSMAAAALGLINAKPKTVKADSINKSRSTLSKANKRAAKTKLSYQTTAYVKTAAPTEDDQKVENDQGTDNEADSENNSQPSVTTQNDDTNTTQNDDVKTNHPKSDSASNKFDADEAKRDDTTSLQGTWTQNKIPVTFNTDTGVMEIGDKTKDSTFNWDGNGSAGIANHIQGITNFDPASVKEIHIIGKMIIQNNADGLFEGLTNLTKITGLEKFDTSKTYDMESMFKDCASLTSLDLSSFNTQQLSQDVSKNYSMQNMFEGCTSLVELNILNFEPDYVSATENMFKGVTKLRKLVVGADFCSSGVSLANTGLGGEGSWVNMGEGEYADSKGQHIYQTTAAFIKETYLNDTYIRFEKLGGKITVYYQDNKNNDIPDMDHDDQFGNIGDSLVNDDPITAFQPKDKVTINGKAYTLSGAKIKDNPVDLKDVKFTADPQDVTLIYAPEAAKPVKVWYKYKDEAGNLHDILDETGKPKTKTISGNIGDKSTVTFDDLANYKKDSYQINTDPVTVSTDNPAVTLSDQDQTVTLIYTPAEPIAAKPVTVYYKYKDKDGKLNDILENGKPKTKTISGNIGDKPVVTFDDLANYKKDSYQINTDPVTVSTDNPAVTLSDQKQTVTLIYTQDSAEPVAAKPVTVYYKYKDKDGKLNDILDETGKPKTKTISGNIGDKPVVTFDELAHYKKDSYQINTDPVTVSTDNPAVTLSDQKQTVTLIYTQDSAEPVAAKPVTVYYKYKDKDGKLNDILENGKPKTKTISGNIGDKPVVTFDELAHYKKDSYQINTDPVTVSTDNPAVTLSDQKQTVTLIYTQDSGNGTNTDNGSGNHNTNTPGNNNNNNNTPGNNNNNTPGNNSSNGSGSNNTPGNNSSNGSGSNNTPGNNSSNGSGNNGSGSNGQNNGNNLPNNEPNNIPTPVNRKPKTVRPHKTINKGFNIKDQDAIHNQQLANSLKNNGSSSNAQNSASNTLPQTGNDKHSSLAMLALGSLALATAIGAAWFGRKKD